jgi:WD40 repeat protein
VPIIEVVGLQDSQITDFDLRRDGLFVAAARDDRVEIWDLKSGSMRSSTKLTGAVKEIRFAQDGGSVDVKLGSTDAVSVALPADAPKLAARPSLEARGVTTQDDAAGIRKLSAEHRARLQKWLKRFKASLTDRGDTAWIGPVGSEKEAMWARVSPDGNIVAVGDRKRMGHYLRLDTNKEWRVLAWSTGSIRDTPVPGEPDALFGPNPDVVLAESTAPGGIGLSRSGRFYDTRTGKPIGAALDDTLRTEGGKWSPDGNLLLRHIAGEDEIAVHDTSSGEVVARFRGIEPSVWSEDGRLVAYWFDGGVVVRDLASSGRRVFEIPAQRARARHDLALRSDDRTLVDVGSNDVMLWDLAAGRRERLIDVPIAWNARVTWDAAERMLAVPTTTGVAIVDLLDRKPIRYLPEALAGATFALRPDGKAIATCGNSVTILPLPEGEPTELSKAPRGSSRCAALAWTSDGRSLAVGWVASGHVDVFDAVDGKRVRRALIGADDHPEKTGAEFGGLAFRPGTRVLFIERSASMPPNWQNERHVFVTDVSTGSLQTSPLEQATMSGWAFSNDSSAVLAWETNESGAKGIAARDPATGTRTMFTVTGTASGRDGAYYGSSALGIDAVRILPDLEAVGWAAEPSAAHQEPFLVALSARGRFCVRAKDQHLRIARRSDNTELSIFAATFGRTDIVVVTDRNGHFDAAQSALPWLRARIDDRAINSGPALEALRSPGLLSTFLTGAK